MSETGRWACGPFDIVDDGFDPTWTKCIDYLQLSGPRAGVPVVKVRAEPHTELHPGPEVSTLFVRRQPGGLEIEAPGSFVAEFVDADDRLTIRSEAVEQGGMLSLTNALRGAVATLSPLRHDSLMCHAASAVRGEHGLMVCGVSTAGKTTFALGLEEAKFLSDDISLVARLSETPWLVPSPFFGSAGKRGFDLDAPLRAVCILSQSDDKTRIETVSAAQAVPELLRHVVAFSTDAEIAGACLSRAVDLCAQVPILKVARHLPSTSSDALFSAVLAHVGHGA